MDSPSSTQTDTEVLIVGAGPVGLTLAVALGRLGIRCMLIERAEKGGILPKMDLSNPRTMEIFGRLGLADKIRQTGWPLDARFDVYVGPSLREEPYKVLSYPSINEMQWQIAQCFDGSMPREPYERISQYNLEALLRREAEAIEHVSVHFGKELIALQKGVDDVRATVRTFDGQTEELRASYLVGCDGGNSTVRRLLDIPLSGRSAVSRMFMIFFRCPKLLEQAGLPPFRHYYLAGKRQATLVAQDDLKRWSLHVQIAADTDVSKLDPRVELREALGLDLDVELLYVGAWTPHLVVADRYSKGRVFMVGDAVHQYIPTGGFGMNTGIAEADNLAWKLAAVLRGWGGARLLDSYHDERQPVAVRNCKAAAYAAEGGAAWRSLYSPLVVEKTKEGLQAWEWLAQAVDQYQRRSHEQKGIELGYRYVGSPICFDEAGSLPDPDSRLYQPTAAPGARLPHAWLQPGVSVHDRIGFGMTLLGLDAKPAHIAAFEKAGRDLRLPLDMVLVNGRPDLRSLYGARLLLLRPDLHVAWRGDLADAPEKILSVSTGSAQAT
ncbi:MULTISPECIES: FAD-dependent monooxygenase [unclassified Bradyrhizobium]|uniref:FAD-dependent monooxygenase n=1 Tax=unclassified Bradyrhizobium TaxID=2631580 RepID=UPI001FF9C75B|nr:MULTISPECIES: FAD-dependent monooxygenase [unclassified Bradyrhizobium]MCK1715990.1 FAD-dependent monooxygenase [Bradyrhizobium sp. 143]MCK1725788.1 FAD-dependent monooxygenase [Bradyrhizobium sp. 142]